MGDIGEPIRHVTDVPETEPLIVPEPEKEPVETGRAAAAIRR